ncbi:hypothetical protein E4U14_005816 [Claviceps sp. LM454 group G7]|nr:hypothetical protein E4U14_005816 [Claviceps sp. LM454 group G7]
MSTGDVEFKEVCEECAELADDAGVGAAELSELLGDAIGIALERAKAEAEAEAKAEQDEKLRRKATGVWTETAAVEVEVEEEEYRKETVVVEMWLLEAAATARRGERFNKSLGEDDGPTKGFQEDPTKVETRC